MTENRLALEKSPYLQQHAENPVDWHPWGNEAFSRAAAEDKPIFLSIGYATCHWCHVMERESFEDEAAAKVLNDVFIPVKVDREERPDVDAVYMTACQMLTGSGGWPLTVFLTPDRKPFFAATYLPKQSLPGRPGLIDISLRVKELWQSDRKKLLESAEGIAGHLGGAFRFQPSTLPDSGIFSAAFEQLDKTFDEDNGGFGSAPKFPTAHRLSFLLLHGHRTASRRAVHMVKKTLSTMRHGGIWDHVGFGFHRYATDRKWFLPHFEKMLYDQALLARVCLEAGQLTGNRLFLQTAEEIFDYVLRDMTSPGVGFFAAEDADSEGEEGKFYVWTVEAFRNAVGDEALSRRWEPILGLEDRGNFSEEATGKKTGANILYLTDPLHRWARRLGCAEQQVEKEWEKIRKALLAARARRIRPLKDEKILTDWNGLMIAALAAGSRILSNPEYGRAARAAAEYILAAMRKKDGRLLHRSRDGEAGIPAMADDYAFFISGLLQLYRTFFDPIFLEHALVLQRQMDEDFWDEESSGFFLAAEGAADLPVRPKELYDGALPSANSVSLSNLVFLSRITGDPQWEQRARKLAASVAGTVGRQPTAFTQMLTGLDCLLYPSREIVIAGRRDHPDTQAMLKAAGSRMIAADAVIVKDEDTAETLARVASFTRDMGLKEDGATAYVCSGQSCDAPVTDPEELARKLLGPLAKSGSNG